jgi:hypothetical protein
VVDTRNDNGPVGGPALQAQQSRDFTLSGGACGIPVDADAFSLNITAIPHKTLGYLSVWPTGQSQPNVSTLNSYDGRIKANAAIVFAGTNGAISLYATDDADIVIDINGYFIDPFKEPSYIYRFFLSGLAFYPVSPCRVLDTRNTTGPLGGPSMTAGEAREIPIAQSACNIPTGAGAYSFNVTAIPKSGTLGYLTTWPSGTDQPYVSTLNSFTGTVTANAAIVGAGENGDVSIFVTDDADVVVDIDGYFASAYGGIWRPFAAPADTLPGARHQRADRQRAHDGCPFAYAGPKLRDSVHGPGPPAECDRGTAKESRLPDVVGERSASTLCVDPKLLRWQRDIQYGHPCSEQRRHQRVFLKFDILVT